MRTFALSCLALACVPALAQSQSTVTVYGIVDVGVQRVTGYKKGADTALVSGIMEGSRIGLRGNEDLGGGWRVLYTLENRTELNNGSTGSRPPSGTQVPDRISQAGLMGLPSGLQAAVTGVAASVGSTIGVNLSGAFWDRQAFLGLVTPVGAIIAGRQYTPAYEINATFDTLGTQSSLAAGQVASIPSSVDIRVSNALQYRIQLGGLTANAFYAFGGSTASSKINRLVGGLVMYKTGPYAAGIGYNTRNNELGEKSLTSTVIGASANIGPGTVSGLYGIVKDDHPTGLSSVDQSLVAQSVPQAFATLVENAFINALRQDGRLMHIGYKMPMGNNTLYVAYSAFDDKRPNNADTASYGVAYTYALSKRTDLNAVVTHFNNKGLAQAAPGQAGFLGGVTASAGTDSNSVAIGIRHRF